MLIVELGFKGGRKIQLGAIWLLFPHRTHNPFVFLKMSVSFLTHDARFLGGFVRRLIVFDLIGSQSIADGFLSSDFGSAIRIDG